jgi:hypothetical protein
MVKKEEIFFRKMTVRLKKEPYIPKKYCQGVILIPFEAILS